MKRTLIVIFAGLLLPLGSKQQEVRLNAFQHVVRWVSESNFPRYITDEDIQDSLLGHTATLLKRKFGTDSVTLPASIDFEYIEYFGKAKKKAMPPAVSPDQVNVNIMSYLTRATVGYAVNWGLEVVASKGGKVIYQKKVPHEIEYYSPAGYMSAASWYTEESFIALFYQLLDEALTDSMNLPGKILVGSIFEKEKLIDQFIAEPKRSMITGRGGFLTGGNFAMALHDGKDTIAKVRYRDGWDTYREYGPPGIGAQILTDLTGITFGYDVNIKNTRNGRLAYENGRTFHLKMSWVNAGTRYTDGTVSYSLASSPVVTDVFEAKDKIASLMYYNYIVPFEGKKSNLQANQIPVAHFIKGIVGTDTVYAELDPQDNIIKVFKNRMPKMAVIMENVAGSDSYSGNKISQNKKFMMMSNVGSTKLDSANAERYYCYYSPAATNEDLLGYMDIIMILLFCIGNR